MHVSYITTLESIMEHKTRQDKAFLSHPNIMWDWHVLTQEAFAFAGLAGFTTKGYDTSNLIMVQVGDY